MKYDELRDRVVDSVTKNLNTQTEIKNNTAGISLKTIVNNMIIKEHKQVSNKQIIEIAFDINHRIGGAFKHFGIHDVSENDNIVSIAERIIKNLLFSDIISMYQISYTLKKYN